MKTFILAEHKFPTVTADVEWYGQDSMPRSFCHFNNELYVSRLFIEKLIKKSKIIVMLYKTMCFDFEGVTYHRVDDLTEDGLGKQLLDTMKGEGGFAA